MSQAEQNIDRLNRLITGDGSQNLGIAARLEIVWRSYIWLIGVASAAGGFLLARLLP